MNYILILAFVFSTSVFAEESKLEPKRLIDDVKSTGLKAMLPDEDSFKGGYNELLKYVMPAPYQDNAGSCLFMSHTGLVEWWMNKLYPNKKHDLSERYFMNLQKSSIGDNQIDNWRTDTIYRLNATGINYRNKDYRFTKGWYKTQDGIRVVAEENEEGAYYGVRYNWIPQFRDLHANSIRMPEFEREIIFADPDRNQWNVNTAPKDIVKKVKTALKRNKAPVLVIYNHTGFWHATLIVGYNDRLSSEGCPFVGSYKEKMHKRADEILAEAEEETDARAKRRLQRKAAKFKSRGNAVHEAYIENGGCRGKGVFYVRDSIYPHESQPLYDFDLTTEGEEEHLNPKVVLHEYEWLERLGNHAFQIFPK